MTTPATEHAVPTPRVSALVPARNEAACIGDVVRALLARRRANGAPLIDEVIVADNGSTDATARVAADAGGRVVTVPQPGYGRACWAAAQAAAGEILIFVDGDGAADPADSAELVARIEAGADLAVGVRAAPEPGAMSAPQRFGNALACMLLRRLWRMALADLGPHRAIRRDAFHALALEDRSFGWIVEMSVRAHRLQLAVVECPVAWHARAGGVSKISGTLSGIVGAGVGILGMIARLWWRERRRPVHPCFIREPQVRSSPSLRQTTLSHPEGEVT